MDFSDDDDEFMNGWVQMMMDDYVHDSETDYDSPSDFDYEFDEDDHIHEMFLYEYSPESKEVEDLTGLDVLKVSDMTIKLVDALKLRLDSEEIDR